MANGPKLLVVAAWEPELTRFRALAASGAPAGLAIALDTLGVGLVEAAIGMTRCIARHRPDLALLLGTAGVLPRASSHGLPCIGDVVVASRIRLVDDSLAAGAAQLPPPMPGEAALDATLHDVLLAAGARSVQIANAVGITVDDALAARLAAAGDDVEHLEAFAFARACASAGVRCGVLLGIANVVGVSGRAEWLANHASASARAAEVAWSARAALAELLRTSTTAPSPERA